MDSVPAEEEKWVYNPFEATKDNKGNIYARGSQDDKCVGMQYLESLTRLKARGFHPLRTVHISFVPDEEIGGGDGAKAFVSSKEFEKLNVGFVLDEGQASPHDHYRVFYADRSPWSLIIKASGAPGHGSKLYDNSAIENLMKSLEDWLHTRVKAGISTPTGFVMNLQPSEAEAGFDIRLPPTADPKLLRKQISEEWAPAVRNMTYQLLEKGPLRDNRGRPLVTTANQSNPWWSLFEQAVLATGGKLAKPEILPSTTDARFVRERGIPAFGFSAMANTPILLHDHNEFLNAVEYLKGIKVYEAVVESFCSFSESVDDAAYKEEL